MTLNEVFQFELFLLVSGLIWKVNTNMLGLLLLIRHHKAGNNESETQVMHTLSGMPAMHN